MRRSKSVPSKETGISVGEELNKTKKNNSFLLFFSLTSYLSSFVFLFFPSTFKLSFTEGRAALAVPGCLGLHSRSKTISLFPQHKHKQRARTNARFPSSENTFLLSLSAFIVKQIRPFFSLSFSLSLSLSHTHTHAHTLSSCLCLFFGHTLIQKYPFLPHPLSLSLEENSQGQKAGRPSIERQRTYISE